MLDRVGITKKDQLDINMKAMHGIFILPAKDGTNKDQEKARLFHLELTVTDQISELQKKIDALRQAEDIQRLVHKRDCTMAT